MRKLIIIAAFLLASCAQTSSDSPAAETLRKSGYTDIELTGWSPFKCDEKDTFSSGFRAKNSNGSTVEGVVCCGLIFKGCTVRF